MGASKRVLSRRLLSVLEVQLRKPPTSLEEVLQLVLERLQILLRGLLAHQLHLLLTCCREKYRID